MVQTLPRFVGTQIPARAPRRFQRWKAQALYQQVLVSQAAIFLLLSAGWAAAEISLGRTLLESWFSWFVVVLLALISALSFTFSFRMTRRERLVEHGHLVLGEVTEVLLKNQPPSKLMVRYQAPDGSWDTLSAVCSYNFASHCRLGARVHVLVYPSRDGKTRAWAPLESEIEFETEFEATDRRQRLPPHAWGQELPSSQTLETPLWSIPEAWRQQTRWLQRSWKSEKSLEMGRLCMDERGLVQLTPNGEVFARVEWSSVPRVHLSAWLLPDGMAEVCLTISSRDAAMPAIEVRSLVSQDRVGAEVALKHARGSYVDEAALKTLWDALGFMAQVQDIPIDGRLSFEDAMLQGSSMQSAGRSLDWDGACVGEVAPARVVDVEVHSSVDFGAAEESVEHRATMEMDRPPVDDLLTGSGMTFRKGWRLFGYSLLAVMGVLVASAFGLAAWEGETGTSIILVLMMGFYFSPAWIALLAFSFHGPDRFSMKAWQWSQKTKALVRNVLPSSGEETTSTVLVSYRGLDGCWRERTVMKVEGTLRVGEWMPIYLHPTLPKYSLLEGEESSFQVYHDVPELMLDHILDEDLSQNLLKKINAGVYWSLSSLPADAKGARAESRQWKWRRRRLGGLQIDSRGVDWRGHSSKVLSEYQAWGEGSHAQLGQFTSENGVRGLVFKLWNAKGQPSVMCKTLLPAEFVSEGLPEFVVGAPWLAPEAFVALCRYAYDHVEHWHGDRLQGDEVTHLEDDAESFAEAEVVEVVVEEFVEV